VVGLLAADLVLAGALFHRAWLHPTAVSAGARTDAPYTIWALAWVARAVTHGHSPWVTDALSWPGGVNLMTNASLTGAGLVLVPVTLLFGPIVAYNMAATSALALSAWSAQLVLRRGLRVPWEAAAVGGLVAGFGPTSIVQTLGDHLHVSSLMLVPPLLLGVGRLASGTARLPGRWGIAVGALVAFQLLLGEEVLAIVAIAVAVGLAAGWRRVDRGCLARGAVMAGVVFVLLATGPLLIQFTGPGHIIGPIQHGEHYANDLTAFVVPTSQFWLRPGSADQVTRHFSSEGGSYIGVPLLAVVLAVIVRRRHDPLVRVLGITGGVVALLSLGSRLTVVGHRYPIPLPWALVAHWPLVVSLLPARFGVVLDLVAGALLALGLHDVARWVAGAVSRSGPLWGSTAVASASVIGSVGAGAVAALALLSIAPTVPVRTTRWAVPAAFRSPGRTGIPTGSVIVVSPYPSVHDPQVEVWLAVAGDRWRTAGGTYFVPAAGGRVTIGGPARAADVLDAALESGQRTVASLAPVARALRASLLAEGVGAVVVGPGPNQARVLGWWELVLGPPRAVGGVHVWLLPVGRGAVAAGR
jgi:hypothetical protein